jgi:hypothetical protein
VDPLQQLLDELAPAAPARSTKRERPSSLETFAKQDIVADGAPFSFAGREPVRMIVETIDRVIRNREAGTQIAILGAEQWGKTISCLIAPALHLIADYGRNIIYFLPSDRFARRFGRTRLKNIIKASPFMREACRDRDVVNQATIKEINGHFGYWLGLQEITDAIAIPADALFYDEVDLLPTDNQEWSEGRVAASDLRLTVFAACGYIPGGGMDSRWQEGTQHKFLVDCSKRGCEKAICLEERFPDCMVEIDGEWRRACPKCKTPLNLGRGKWIATYPERAKQKKYSFRVSSLIIEARDAAHIMDRWEKAKRKKSKKAKFNCAELAIPDAGAMQPITDAELMRMRSRFVMDLAPSGRARYAGVDTGDQCHLWVFEEDETGHPILMWLEALDSDNAEAIVGERIVQLGIVSMVIDKKPLTTLARALAYRFPYIVALIDFTDNATLHVVDEEHQKKTYRCVKVDRNESLDEFASAITDESKHLVMADPEFTPDEQTERLYEASTHLKNLRKERTMTANGRVIDKFVRNAPNHYGMAGNFALIAKHIAPPHIRITVPRFPTQSRHAQLTSMLAGIDADDRRTLAPQNRVGRKRALRRCL